MQRVMMKSKLHGATVTMADLGYVGSLTIDRNLMEVADLLPNEKLQVVNVVGPIDLAKLGALGGVLGIPRNVGIQ